MTASMMLFVAAAIPPVAMAVPADFKKTFPLVRAENQVRKRKFLTIGTASTVEGVIFFVRKEFFLTNEAAGTIVEITLHGRKTRFPTIGATLSIAGTTIHFRKSNFPT